MERRVNHRGYVERYLESGTDGEAGSAEDRAVSLHVANCKECEALLTGERSARTMLRENVPTIPATDALRQRILAALDAEDRIATRREQLRRFRRPALWIASASLAAGLTLFALNLRLRAVDNRAFDSAVASFVDSEKHFSPTVGAKSPDDLAVALINQFGVPLVWDFSTIGLTPRGGRIDKMPDGKVVAYSMYSGAKGSLLCIIDRSEGFHFPPGDRVVKGMHLYSYEGYSIAATNRYSVFCIMISDLPLEDLARAFDRLPS